MNKGIAIGVGALAVGGLVYFASRAGSAKSFVANMTVEPLWYGGINDMKFSTTGVKLPLAIDLGNRSSERYKVKVNACDVFLGGSKVAASKAALVEAVIEPYATTRIPIDVVLNYSFLVELIGSSITSLIMGEGADKIKDVVSRELEIRLDFAVNDFVQTPLSLNLSTGEVSLNGLGLVSYENREIGSLNDYKYLLPKEEPENSNPTLITDVTPEQTAVAIRKFAQKYAYQTAKLARKLKADTVEETVQRVFDFVYHYIKYVPDSTVKEQVRTPLRCLHDQAGDCDCYSVLIASIFENLGIKYVVRIAEYANKGYYQHVYVVALVHGREYVCDPVIEKCFTEKEYSRKKDF